MATKIQIGTIGVDSGQVMVIDPCYLKGWRNNEFIYQTFVVSPDGKTQHKVYPGHRWNDPLPEVGKSGNELLDEGWSQRTEYYDAGELSYSGMCGITCGDVGYGQDDRGLGFVTSTVHGDGGYPVYGHFRKGEKIPYKIEIMLE